MKNFKNYALSAMLLLIFTSVFSQGKITGTIIDSELNTPVAGSNILIKGTNKAVISDIEGRFTITSNTPTGTLVISFIGLDSKNLKFSVTSGESIDLGTIGLTSLSNKLDEIVIKSSVIDIAKDRKTPVAVSTIKSTEITQKLGNQEFPEILANTPSVYATKTGGGFGDSRINIRGFDQKNIAVMVNGIPINDMENSAVFWSNWAGLSDVTSAMQVQRGLGSSKLAISSVGGTINIVTRTADMKQGGIVSAGVANNNYLKTGISYSTGKMKNGLSTSILLNQTSGNEYADGTQFEAANYFIGVGYEINKKNDIQLTITGAPQWHNQRSTAPSINDYIKYSDNGEPNRRYNADAGYLNGNEYNFRTNYYHKPIASLNWDYKISEKTKLSTVLYASTGRGGGTSGSGGIRGNSYNNAIFKNPDGTINVDKINNWNNGTGTITVGPTTYTRSLTGGSYVNSIDTGSSNTTSGISKLASTNSHDWFGGVVSLNTRLTEKLTLDFGVDLRTYKGIHFQTVNDNLGADFYLDKYTGTNGNINDQNTLSNLTYNARPNFNPFWNTDYQKKVNYNNDSKVNWLGAFTQLEYSTEKVTVYLQGAVSQQGFKRIDHFKYLDSDPLSSSSFKNILGGNIKGGINYNIDAHNNVFANAGYYSKQPFFNAVYPNNASVINGNLINEKIMGIEVGYGFRSSIFNANVNLYHTTWKDRYQRNNDADPTNPGGYYDFSGIQEIHSGVEVDLNAKVSSKFKLNGMFSLGNWEYKGNVLSNRYDVSNNPVAGGTATTLYLDKVKVGDAAQLTTSLGGSYEVIKRVTLDANYRYIDKLYAAISPANFSTETNKGSLKLPTYGLMDAGFSYKMLVGKDKLNSVNFRVNVNNVLDRTYIAESRTNNFVKTQDDFKFTTGPNIGQPNTAAFQTYQDTQIYNGVDKSNQVFFGFGRTWNFTLSYNF